MARRDCHMKTLKQPGMQITPCIGDILISPAFAHLCKPFQVRKLFILQPLARRCKVATPSGSGPHAAISSRAKARYVVSVLRFFSHLSARLYPFPGRFDVLVGT